MKPRATCRASLTACCALLLVLVGGFPWAYTPWLLGERPGSEGAGMFGTLIFIMVGVPGLALTVIAFIARKMTD